MKKRKLEMAYDEISSKYSDNGKINKDLLNNDVEVLNKKIEGMTKNAYKTEDTEKRKNIMEQIQAVRVKKQNLEGYAKYNEQISKIRDYKAKLSNKLKTIEQSNDKGTKKIESLGKDLESRKKTLEGLNKQNDPEKTVSLTNTEYDDLQEKIKTEKEKIAKIEKEISEIKAKIEIDKKKVEELKGKIGKCDLAWKTLFTNKDWDEIQRRTIEDKKRFTKKEDKTVDKVVDNGQENDKEDKDVKEKDPTYMVPAQKPSLFKRFTNFVKKAAKGFKDMFIVNNENELDETTTTTPKKDVAGKVKEIKENIAKSEEKDKFIEGLRFNVDTEYRQNVTEGKEKAYIEKHKIKPIKDADEKEEER